MKIFKMSHIEVLRAIASMMVVLFHFISFSDGKQFLFESASVRKISEFGAQGVEMFYIISGFVMVYTFKKNDFNVTQYLSYLLKRFFRILPTYWFTILLICSVSFCLHTFLWKIPYDWNIRNMVTNATFTADLFGREWINPVFITLKVEFQFYIVIGLLYPVWSRNFIFKLVLIAVFLTLAQFSTDYNNFPKYMPYFLTGMACYEIFSAKNLKNIFLGLVPLIFILTFYETEDILISSLTALLIIINIPYPKLISKLGEVSYSLYLTHGVSGGWILYFLHLNFGNSNNVLLLILAILSSILVATIIYFLVEKPSLKISQKILYKNTFIQNTKMILNDFKTLVNKEI